MLIISLEMIAVMPRAKNMPARVNNEWLNVHISYKKSLHKSKYDSGYQHDQNCGNRADLCPLHHPGQHHAGHGNEGTNADINAAGDHNGGHADTDHDQACVGNKQV